MATTEKQREEASEIDAREKRTLARLLMTPPDHKQSAKATANPKKRGRPPNSKRAAPGHNSE